MSEDKPRPTTGTGNRHGKPIQKKSKADDVKKLAKEALKPPSRGRHRKS